MRITAAQADELAGGPWFDGYTSTVDIHQVPITFDEFDAEARAKERHGPEFAVFTAGLTVRGTLDLARDMHCIYVVQGTLRAERLVLGDAVLAVDGPLVIGEWLFGDRNEGIFEVSGRQVESDQDDILAHIQAPTVALFDRARYEFVLGDHGRPRQAAHLVPGLLDDDQIDPELLLARLRSRQQVFRQD